MKKLIAYFSPSGNTKAMAEKLANVEPENQRQTLGGLSGLFSKMFRNRNK